MFAVNSKAHHDDCIKEVRSCVSALVIILLTISHTVCKITA